MPRQLRGSAPRHQGGSRGAHGTRTPRPKRRPPSRHPTCGSLSLRVVRACGPTRKEWKPINNPWPVPRAACRVVRLRGELDIANILDLPTLLRGTWQQTQDTWLIVDLRPVTFMDSTTIRALLTAQKHCEQASKGLRLVYDQAFISRLLALHGATAQFPRYTSTDDAWVGRETPPER
ncbi:STAS domain-containing protein [Streptomyces sp. NPDC051214]|uniref:STAS domain-containing protein n=1 Tax=Streptomyces sp. NPDC051214 TaxID=3155282 RepID=UPI00342B2C98